MTGPRGGETTVTAGGLRRTTFTLDAGTLSRLDLEAETSNTSRSDVIRRLARQLPKEPRA